MVYLKQISIDTNNMQLPVVEHNTIAGKERLSQAAVNYRQSRI